MNRMIVTSMLLALGVVLETSGLAQADSVALADLQPLFTGQSWGSLQKNQSVSGKPLRIADRTFTNGLGTHALSEIVYALDGTYDRFDAWVGVDAAVLKRTNASVVFKVMADGRELFDSGIMRAETPARRVSVPVTGVSELTLVVTDAGDGRNSDQADWAEPVLFRGAPIARPAEARDPAKFKVSVPEITLQLSDKGAIVGGVFDGTRRALFGETRLTGCTNAGAVTSRKLPGGGVEFARQIVHAASQQKAALVERFSPMKDSIRWELEIRGAGGPWSTGIETRLQWPEAQAANARFWTAWDDPDVQEGDWRNPLEMRPFVSRRFWYGCTHWSETNPSPGYHPARGWRFVLPLAIIAENQKDLGFSLALSPEDTLLELSLTTRRNGGVVFSRNDHRISAEKPVRFAMDLVAHKADWRAALSWMTRRYPEYFNPPNPHAFDFAGLAAYSDWEGDLDAAKLQRMGFGVNWKASYDFPYMGMFLPPIPDGERYPRLVKGNTTSIAQLRDYSHRMRQMGFHVLNYFNVTEFGATLGMPKEKDPTLAPADQWKNVKNFLYGQVEDGILHDLQGREYGSWEGCIAMDVGAPKYRGFVLDQAQRHVEKLPDSSGICIDRMDWLRFYNFEADDGVSWRSGRPCRSLYCSWRSLLSELGPIFHRADKAVFVNAIVNRLELMRDVDGLYHEIGHLPGDLNGTALQCVLKPCMVWTPDEKTLQPDPDAYFQRHLHMGAFPTAPLPKNDHTICPSAWADEQYLRYGAMFNCLRGRKWVLQPHVIEAEGALANLFQVPGGYIVPLTFGATAKNATVRLRESAFAFGKKPFACQAIHPGSEASVPVNVRRQKDWWLLEVPLQHGCAMVKISAEKQGGH